MIEASKVKRLPDAIFNNKEMIDEAFCLGCINAKVVFTNTLALARWTRLQCQYGCSHYGKCLTCPPFSPTLDEMSFILMDYRQALMVQTNEGNQVLEVVVALEEGLKRKGFRKAFGLTAMPCDLCEVCTIDTVCQNPDKARPTIQACGIDVAQTVFNNGWDLGQKKPNCSGEYSVGLVLIH